MCISRVVYRSAIDALRANLFRGRALRANPTFPRKAAAYDGACRAGPATRLRAPATILAGYVSRSSASRVRRASRGHRAGSNEKSRGLTETLRSRTPRQGLPSSAERGKRRAPEEGAARRCPSHLDDWANSSGLRPPKSRSSPGGSQGLRKPQAVKSWCAVKCKLSSWSHVPIIDFLDGLDDELPM